MELKKRKRKSKKRKVNRARNRYKPWTEEEVNRIMQFDKPDEELAEELGRDVRSLKMKRYNTLRAELKKLAERIENGDRSLIDEIRKANGYGE
jgi:protein subunit release factor A